MRCNIPVIIFVLLLNIYSFAVAEEHTVTSGDQGAGVFSGSDSLKKVTDGTTNGGTYTITQQNSYTGLTTIEAGTIKLNYAGGGGNSVLSGRGLIVINKNGTLDIANGNVFGFAPTTPTLITVNGGTINSSFANHSNIGGIVLNGGSITSTVDATSTYGNFLLGGPINVTDDATISASKITVRTGGNGLENSGIWTVASGKTLTVSSKIRVFDVEYATTLNKSGTGTLLITGSNADTMRGKIVLSAGTLQYGNGGEGGGLADPLEFKGGNLVVNRTAAFTASSVTVSENAEIRNIGTGQMNFSSAALAAGKTLSIDGSGAVAFSGVVSGDGSSIVKSGAGTLSLTGANTYTGGTTISGGTVAINKNNALGTGAVTLNGGTLDFTAGLDAFANPIQVLSDSIVKSNKGDVITTGAFSGSGNVSKSGENIFHVSGSLAGYSGAFEITQNYYIFRGTATNGSGCSIDMQTGSQGVAFIADSGTTFAFGMINGSGEVRPSGNANNTGKTITVKVGNDTDYSNHTLTGAINNFNGNVIAVEKTGSNTWTINSAGSYSGGTTISGGVLEIGNSGVLGTGAVTLNGGTLRATETVSSNFSGITLAADSQIDVAADKTFSVSKAITGSGKQLEKAGTGTLKVTNTSNNPNWNVAAGTLEVDNLAALGSGTINIAANGTLKTSGDSITELAKTITGTGTLLANSSPNLSVTGDLSGFNGTFMSQTSYATIFKNTEKGMSGMVLKPGSNDVCFTDNCAARVGMIVGTSGTIRPSNANQGDFLVDLIVGNDIDYTNSSFSGTIRDQYDSGSGKTWTISVEKTGSNSWTLGGNNQYTKGTKITDGTLVITNVKALGTGAVTLQGGTLEHNAANGTFANPITVANKAEATDLSDLSFAATGAVSGNLTINRPMAISVDSDKIGTISSVITGSGVITKSGAGQLKFTNASAGYNGSVEVSEGTLYVGSGALSSAEVSLLGTGSLVIDPGTVLNSLKLNQAMDVEIIGGAIDTIDYANRLEIGDDFSLSVTSDSILNWQTYEPLTFVTADLISGPETFAVNVDESVFGGLPDVGLIARLSGNATDGYLYQLDLDLDLDLAVPEPATWLLLLFGTAGLAGLKSRRSGKGKN